MLATALRSLVVVDCGELAAAESGKAHEAPLPTLFDTNLEAGAVALDWDARGGRVVLATAADAAGGGRHGGSDRVCILQPRAASSGSQVREERIPLPPGGGALDICVRCGSDDATWIAAACADGSLRVMNAATYPARATRMVRAHSSAATAVHISSDVRLLASGCATGQVVVQSFDQPHGTGLTLPGLADEREAAVTALRFAPLRPDVVAGCDTAGSLQLWNAATQDQVCKFPKAHRGAARCLSFSTHNQSLLISGGEDAQLNFWDVTSKKLIKQMSTEHPLASISYHEDGYLVAAGTGKGAVFIYDLRKVAGRSLVSAPLCHLTVHQDRIASSGGSAALRALAFAPGGCSLQEAPPSPGGEVSRRSSAPPAFSAAADEVNARADPFGDRPSRAAASLQDMFSRLSTTRGPNAALVERLSSERAATQTQAQAPGQVPPAPLGRGVGGASALAAAMGAAAADTAAAAATDGSGNAGAGSAPGASASVAGGGSGVGVSRSLPPTTPVHAGRLQRARTDGAFEASAAGPAGSAGTGPHFFDIAGSPLPQMPCGGGGGGTAAAAGAVRYDLSGSPQAPSVDDVGRSPGSPDGSLRDMRRDATDASGDGRDRSLKGDARQLALIAEAMRPLLGELRRDLGREVREAQCAILEQNFRMHSELRRDVEELRAEVQELRGELRVLQRRG
eukprot:TRINITY_DN28880_c0_g1_i1.p1 TRINITY_DN28880_c0_g1~~TRINITY_DN28880_c0_g1_i1.p1  ORF type:complete len:752 (-),score=156.20 TRINITY_DN28880_c0_g1_i1:88-2130(-)